MSSSSALRRRRAWAAADKPPASPPMITSRCLAMFTAPACHSTAAAAPVRAALRTHRHRRCGGFPRSAGGQERPRSASSQAARDPKPAASTAARPPRSTITATPITSAPASCSASAAVSGLLPGVEASSATSTGRPPASDVRTLDPALQAVRLAGLADDAGVQEPLARGGCVQHRGRHRVGAQGEAADDVVAQVAGELPHHPAHQRRALVVQRQPAHVDVPVRLPARGEGDPPVHHGELDDELQQPVTVGEGGGSGRHALDPTEGQASGMAHRNRLLAAAGPPAAAAVGTLATEPGRGGFRQLDKPAWYPPTQTFGIVWTGLYTALGWAAGEVLSRDPARRRAFARAYAANLVLNAGWTPLFFRAHRPWAAAVESAVLTASTVDLVRRAAPVSRPAAAALVPYAAWTAFATALTGAIARRNPRHGS